MNTVVCDVGDREQVANLVARALDRFGQIDILVNNAGVIQVAPLENLSIEHYERAMDTMYWGVVFPTLAVLPHMRARGEGAILNVTSVGGVVSIPHLSPYSAAKFAAVGFSEGLRAELDGTGIKVTTVIPGLMRTGSHLNALFGGRAAKEATWFSLGASLPLITISGERAARGILNASSTGQPIAVLGLPARGLILLHGLFPGLTARILGLANRFILPAPAAERTPELQTGRDALSESPLPLVNWLTAMGRSAADRTNQHPGPRPSVDQPGATQDVQRRGF